jgi:hypothetical protein
MDDYLSQEIIWVTAKSIKSRFNTVLKTYNAIKIMANIEGPPDALYHLMNSLYGSLVDQFDGEERIINLLIDDKYAFFKKQHLKYHDDILDMVEFTCAILRSQSHPTATEYFPHILSTLIDNMINDDKRLIEYLNDECIEYHSLDTR